MQFINHPLGYPATAAFLEHKENGNEKNRQK